MAKTPTRASDLDVRVISIGALDMNPLWGERTPTRSGHATTTLLRVGDRRILVDPGLPASALAARLGERSGLTPDAITHVFLTSFRPDCRRALDAFPEATWWISEAERESVGVPLAMKLREALDENDEEVMDALHREVALLQRCEPAPDQLADRVSLFPLPGVTPGMTGLLLAEPRHTTLITGDAIPTVEHLLEGQAPRGAVDVAQARQSLTEAIEIADFLVLGRDNLVVNPVRRPF